MSDWQKNVPCRYYMFGSCSRSDQCPYLHEETTYSQETEPYQSEQEEGLYDGSQGEDVQDLNLSSLSLDPCQDPNCIEETFSTQPYIDTQDYGVYPTSPTYILYTPVFQPQPHPVLSLLSPVQMASVSPGHQEVGQAAYSVVSPAASYSAVSPAASYSSVSPAASYSALSPAATFPAGSPAATTYSPAAHICISPAQQEIYSMSENADQLLRTGGSQTFLFSPPLPPSEHGTLYPPSLPPSKHGTLFSPSLSPSELGSMFSPSLPPLELGSLYDSTPVIELAVDTYTEPACPSTPKNPSNPPNLFSPLNPESSEFSPRRESLLNPDNPAFVPKLSQTLNPDPSIFVPNRPIRALHQNSPSVVEDSPRSTETSCSDVALNGQASAEESESAPTSHNLAVASSTYPFMHNNPSASELIESCLSSSSTELHHNSSASKSCTAELHYNSSASKSSSTELHHNPSASAAADTNQCPPSATTQPKHTTLSAMKSLNLDPPVFVPKFMAKHQVLTTSRSHDPPSLVPLRGSRGWRAPTNWAEAPEFVPKTAEDPKPRSWAQVVTSNITTSQSVLSVADVESQLCPYYRVGECRYDSNCLYIHGESCDYCAQNCLHPTNQGQRRSHQAACLREHESDMEHSFAVARSKDKTCGICMETVLDKPKGEARFGILPSCTHCFCLPCIRKWRQAKQFEHKIIRACPECRQTSDFICPSRLWVETAEEKDALLNSYKKNLGLKECKYFNKGVGECPFGNKCFYRHADKDGRSVDVGPPKKPARRTNADGNLSLVQRLLLYDFLEERDGQIVFPLDFVELFDLYSDSDEWSDGD